MSTRLFFVNLKVFFDIFQDIKNFTILNLF